MAKNSQTMAELAGFGEVFERGQGVHEPNQVVETHGSFHPGAPK